GLARERELMGAADRAKRIAGWKTARGVFTGQQAHDDAVLGTDARRDHAADFPGAARPVFGTAGGAEFIGPDLLAAGAIHEARRKQRLAGLVARHALQFEAGRGGRRKSGGRGVGGTG